MSLILERVSRSFGRQQALDDVSFALEPGECLGFIGHNGAGKTTAMRIALGLIPAETGRVLIEGKDIRKSPLWARNRLGAHVERANFYDELDARTNLRRLGRVQGLDGATSRSEADRVLRAVGLDSVGAKGVGAFSQGMRQRLGIAQALLGSPQYLLLDEPANGLDPEGMAEMRALVRRLAKEEGHGVLLSSHLLFEVAEICDRIAVLKKGQLLAVGPKDDVLAGGDRRVRVEVDNHPRAKEVLKGLGCETLEESSNDLVIDTGTTKKGTIIRSLVEADLAVESFAPERGSLEAIYLAMSADSDQVAPKTLVDVEPTRAAPALPRFGLFRAMGWEFRRVASRPLNWLLLLAPALVAAYRAHDHLVTKLAESEALAEDGVMHARVTAFEGVPVGLSLSLPLLALIFVLVASQSLAGELGRGTMRNLVLRPLRRWEIVMGKFFALAVIGGVAIMALLGGCVASSAYVADFIAIGELLPNGEVMEFVTLDELNDALKRSLLSQPLALLGYLGLGFAVSSLVRQGTIALGLGLAAFFGEVVLRNSLADSWGERFALSSYVPSILGDRRSPIGWLSDIGASNALEPFFDSMYWAPALWMAAALGLAILIFQRRSIA